MEVLAAQGCTVEVLDPYAMKFKATAYAEDIPGWYPVTQQYGLGFHQRNVSVGSQQVQEQQGKGGGGDAAAGAVLSFLPPELTTTGRWQQQSQSWGGSVWAGCNWRPRCMETELKKFLVNLHDFNRIWSGGTDDKF